jgi:excisionase family DNA binding protein
MKTHRDLNLFTATEAAHELGVTARRVRAMLQSGDLPALRVKRLWLVTEKDLQEFQQRPRKPGRATAPPVGLPR